MTRCADQLLTITTLQTDLEDAQECQRRQAVALQIATEALTKLAYFGHGAAGTVNRALEEIRATIGESTS